MLFVDNIQYIFQYFLRGNRTGTVTINIMTTPMMKMPSVEPISEMSSAGGVGVACKASEAAPKFWAETVGWPNMAIHRMAENRMKRTDIQRTVFVFIVIVIVTCIKSS